MKEQGMKEVVARGGSTVLETFQWPEVQKGGLGLDERSRDFRTLVYSKDLKEFKFTKARKSKANDELFFFPKKYKGKRLSKNETLFLLNVRKRWGEYVTAKPEYVDSLLAMHRFSAKKYRGIGLRLGILFGGLPGIFAVSYTLSGHATGGAVFGTVGVILPVAVAAITGLINRYDSTDNVIDIWGDAESNLVHSDFLDFHHYLKKLDWSGLSVEQRSHIRDVPNPRHVEEHMRAGKVFPRLGSKPESANLLAIESPSVSPSPLGKSWSVALSSFESVKKEWTDWEMDILKVVQYPALFDMREASTLGFHRALIVAESKKSIASLPYAGSHSFVDAVNDLQLAWSVAKSEARRIQQSNFAEKERGRLSRAVDLLRIALNSSGTPFERQSSYKQAMKQLEGLVQIPSVAMSALESRAGLKVLEQS